MNPPGSPLDPLAIESMRLALGAAITRARGRLSQAHLGHLLGDLPQTTISRWENGRVQMSIETMWHLEAVLGLRPGTLLVEAGYLPKDLLAPIAPKPDLDGVRLLLRLLSQLLGQAESDLGGGDIGTT